MVKEYIERNPAKCFSMPSLIGRRITVYNIITQIDGDGLEATLNDFELSEPQVKAAIDYCIAFECKIDSDKHQFCDGCTLRVLADGEPFDRNDYTEIIDENGFVVTRSNDDYLFFIGTVDELEKEEAGKDGWIIAARLREKYREELQ